MKFPARYCPSVRACLFPRHAWVRKRTARTHIYAKWNYSGKGIRDTSANVVQKGRNKWKGEQRDRKRVREREGGEFAEWKDEIWIQRNLLCCTVKCQSTPCHSLPPSHAHFSTALFAHFLHTRAQRMRRQVRAPGAAMSTARERYILFCLFSNECAYASTRYRNNIVSLHFQTN